MPSAAHGVARRSSSSSVLPFCLLCVGWFVLFDLFALFVLFGVVCVVCAVCVVCVVSVVCVVWVACVVCVVGVGCAFSLLHNTLLCVLCCVV